MLEFLLCVHLFLEDTWSGLEVFVLDLVVWLLTFLAIGGVAMAFMGLWIVTHLIDAGELLGLNSNEHGHATTKRIERASRHHADQSSQAARVSANAEEPTTLLTDAPVTTAADQQRSTLSRHDESILSASLVHEDDEHASADADDSKEVSASAGLRAALLSDSDNVASSFSSSSSSSLPSGPSSVTVQVQPVLVSDSSLSLNGDSESVVSSHHVVVVPTTSPSTSEESKLDLASYDNILSAYLNFSVVLVIFYFGFSLLLLAQRGQVADYVHTHALMHGIVPVRHAHGVHYNHGIVRRADGELEDPTQAADVLKTQLSAYLAVMGIFALFSSKLSSLAGVAMWIIQQKRLPTQQAYLTSHLTIGMWGCILLSLHIYIAHHQTFVPIQTAEIEWMGVVGMCLIAAAVGGIWRFYQWTPRLQPIFRIVHMSILGLFTFILFLLSATLWMRTKQGPYYHAPPVGSESDEDTASPMRAVEAMESIWQLELAAQLKISVISMTNLITAAYTALTAVMAAQLDRIRMEQTTAPTTKTTLYE